MKRRMLALAVMSTVFSVGFVMSANAAENADQKLSQYSVDEVIVEGSRDLLPGGFVKSTSNVGIMGKKSIMETPFTKANLSEKAITAFETPGEGLTSALLNVPSVRSASSPMYNDFWIRGSRITGYQMYINGVPGLLAQTNIPTNFVGSIEVTSGPVMGVTGTTVKESAGGMVNLVSKRASGEDITKYKQTFSGKSVFGEYIDVGRRFGENKSWGLRVNAQNSSGETAIPGEKLNTRDIFINLDHVDAKSNTNLLAGYRFVNHKNGVRWFQYDKGVTKLPSAPDSKNNYSFRGQEMEYDTWLATLNHEQKLNDSWTAFANIGYSKYDLYKNYNAESSSYLVTNNNGDFKAKSWSKTFPVESYFGQLGIKGEFATGDVKHNVSLAVDKAWYNSGGAPSVSFNQSVFGNLYDKTNIVGEELPASNLGGYTARNEYWGISLADSMKYGKAELLLGVHKHNVKVDSYQWNTGAHTGSTQKSDSTSPTFALSYSPDDKVTIYANHAESFDKGARVPGSANGNILENHDEMLSPTKTKQNEIGVKYQNKGILTTLSLFNLKQAANMDVQKDGKWYRVQDGENEFKGIELTVNGKIADKWNVMGGITYLNGKVNRSASVASGTKINGTPKWNGVMSLEYQADDDFSVLGRALYFGDCTIQNERLEVPSYLTFDLGVKYKTKVSHTPVTLSAMCYNLTGKDYWITSGNTTILSNPRTFMLSAEFDL